MSGFLHLPFFRHTLLHPQPLFQPLEDMYGSQRYLVTLAFVCDVSSRPYTKNKDLSCMVTLPIYFGQISTVPPVTLYYIYLLPTLFPPSGLLSILTLQMVSYRGYILDRCLMN